MPKATTNHKIERKMWTKQQQSFLLDCIKRRAHIIESDQNDAFSRDAKLLAWKDVESQIFKRFQRRCDVVSLKKKWGKLKYAAKRKASDCLIRGEELSSSDWESKVLEMLSSSSAANAESELSLNVVGNVDDDNSSMNGDPVFSIEYPGRSQPDDDLLASVQDENISETSCESNVDLGETTSDVRPPKVELDTSQQSFNMSTEAEVEVSFRRQLYQETLERLQQEHQLKMDLLRVKCEEERVKLDILRIQRDEAQRRADSVKHDRRSAEQWFAQTTNHTDDHFTISD